MLSQSRHAFPDTPDFPSGHTLVLCTGHPGHPPDLVHEGSEECELVVAALDAFFCQILARKKQNNTYGSSNSFGDKPRGHDSLVNIVLLGMSVRQSLLG